MSLYAYLDTGIKNQLMELHGQLYQQLQIHKIIQE